MNIDGSEDDLFIANNDDEEVEENVAEADQMVAVAKNEEKVDTEIVNEKVYESFDDISSVAFAESDDEEKIYRVCNSTKIDKEECELIEAFQEELDESIFPKRLEDGALHKFYGIKQKKRSSSLEM